MLLSLALLARVALPVARSHGRDAPTDADLVVAFSVLLAGLDALPVDSDGELWDEEVGAWASDRDLLP